MKWASPIKCKNQLAGLRHFCRVIFDDFARLKRLRDIPRGNIAFEHALNCMDTEKDTGVTQLELLLLLARREAVGDSVGSMPKGRTDAVIHGTPVCFGCGFLVLAEILKPLH